MFLGFANFYKRFIRNFSRIAAPPTSMLRTTNESTGDKTESTQAENQDAPGAADVAGSGRVGGSFENLSTVVKSAESKKPKLTKSKKSDWQRPIPERIFLLTKLKRPSYTYEKLLPRLRFLGILTKNVIFGLRLILWGMLLVGSSVT